MQGTVKTKALVLFLIVKEWDGGGGGGKNAGLRKGQTLKANY